MIRTHDALATTMQVEPFCLENKEQQDQLVNHWVRFFAIGVIANFSDFALDEQVRYIAKAVFGKDTSTKVSVERLIEMLHTEMQKEAHAETDFWTSTTASDAVYSD